MNSKQLSQEYDKLYQQAADILKDENPCQVKSCRICAGGTGTLLDRRSPTYCCSGCPFVSKKGRCTVKALGCKIWICKSAAQKNPTAYEKLKVVRDRAIELGVLIGMNSWLSKKPCLLILTGRH